MDPVTYHKPLGETKKRLYSMKGDCEIMAFDTKEKYPKHHNNYIMQSMDQMIKKSLSIIESN